MLAKLKYICWEQWDHWYKYTSVLFLALFTVMFYALATQEDEPFIALGGSAYDSVQGSVLTAAGNVVVSAGDKCNLTDHPIEVEGETVWRRLDVLGENVPGFKGTARYEARECRKDLAFVNPLPTEITEGVWEYTGIETAHWKGESHTRTWRTEPFEVRQFDDMPRSEN